VLLDVIGQFEKNRRLLSVILDYLLLLSKSGHDPETRVRRRTIKVRHILASMVIAGVRSGELAPVNVRAVDDLLYGLLESAIFRLAVLKRKNLDELRQAVRLAVERLTIN
jgi:hypothetical protein